MVIAAVKANERKISLSPADGENEEDNWRRFASGKESDGGGVGSLGEMLNEALKKDK